MMQEELEKSWREIKELWQRGEQYRQGIMLFARNPSADFREDIWKVAHRQNTFIRYISLAYAITLCILVLKKIFSPARLDFRLLGGPPTVLLIRWAILYANSREMFLFTFGIQGQVTVLSVRPKYWRGITTSWELKYATEEGREGIIPYRIDKSIFVPETELPKAGEKITVFYNPYKEDDLVQARPSHVFKFCLSKERVGEIGREQQEFVDKYYKRRGYMIYLIAGSPIVVGGSALAILMIWRMF